MLIVPLFLISGAVASHQLWAWSPVVVDIAVETNQRMHTINKKK